MGYPHKIVTCCYCGTRAALVLRGRTRHELTCASCGAPLHDLKMLPKDRTGPRDVVNRPGPRDVVNRAPPRPQNSARPNHTKKYRSKRKGLLKRVFKEAVDILEDILD